MLCAFASLALGGAVPLPAAAVLFLLLCLAFACEGRVPKDSRWPSAVLLVLLAVLARLWWTDALEPAVAASVFAASLMCQRILVRQSASDDGLIHLMALLMLAGGAALTADLIYAVCFVGFALGGTTALVMSHLAASAEASGIPLANLERLLSRRLFLSVAGLSAAALVMAAGLFFLFPRMTAGAFARNPSASGRTGLASEIRLGGSGLIKDDPRPALRVRLFPDPGVESLEMHWRARVFEAYDGIAWTRGSRSGGALGSPGLGMPQPRLRVGTDAPEPALRAVIDVLPASGAESALVPENTVLLEKLRSPRMGFRHAPPTFFAAAPDGEVPLTQPVPQNGFSYEAVIGVGGKVRASRHPWSGGGFALCPVLDASALEALPEMSFEAGNDGGEGEREIPEGLLDLPPSLDGRIAALARQLTEGERTAAGKVAAIGRHLSGFTYDASMESSTSDPLAEFLFERRRGHCELFAAAMAVLLRASGVPARTVGGFYGGTRSPEGGYVVRLAAAHAWVEVFVPGIGFVAVDPTPQDGRAPQNSGFITWLSDRRDELSEVWRRAVVDLSFWDQWQALRRLHRSASGLSAAAPSAKRGSRARASSVFVRLHDLGRRLFETSGDALISVLFLGAALAALRRWSRRLSSPGLTGPAARLYRRLMSALRRRGFVPGPSETLRELIGRMEASGDPAAVRFRAVAERCLAARFGGRPMDSGEAKRLAGTLRD